MENTGVIFKNNGEQNKAFLDALDSMTRNRILESIAEHYGTNVSAIELEVFSNDAYWLLEYMIEPFRSITYSLMVAHGYGSAINNDNSGEVHL